MPSTSPWRLRSSGTRPSPARIAARGDDRRTGLPPTSTRPDTWGSRPNSACATSERPAPTRPARPTTSPARTRARRRETCPGLDSFSTRSSSSPGADDTCCGDVLVEAAPDHQVHQRRLVERAGRLGRDVGAVAQHGHRVAEPEDLRHAVRDVDAGDAALAQAAHERVQPIGLVLRQAAGRLVEDDHARAAADGGGDLHHLLLAERQLADAGGARRCRPRRPHLPRSRPASRARAAPSRACRRRAAAPADGPGTGSRRRSGSRTPPAPGARCRCRRAARRAGLRSSTCRPSTITSPASGA